MTNTALQLPEDVLPMVPRTAMPQIDEIYYPDMLVWLGSRGVSFSAGYMEPLNCRVHQQIDFDRADNMPEKALKKPVLLSGDFRPCVLDGDHRWWRHLADKTQMPYIMIHLDFFAAKKMLEDYPKCYEVSSDV